MKRFKKKKNKKTLKNKCYEEIINKQRRVRKTRVRPNSCSYYLRVYYFNRHVEGREQKKSVRGARAPVFTGRLSLGSKNRDPPLLSHRHCVVLSSVRTFIPCAQSCASSIAHKKRSLLIIDEKKERFRGEFGIS